MKKTTVALIALVLMTGCATNFADKPPAEVARAVQVKDTAFDAKKLIGGPLVASETKRFPFTDSQSTYLLVEKDRVTGALTNYTLFVRVIHNGPWRFFQSASFVGGAQVEVKVGEREVSACGGSGFCVYTESVGIPIKEEVIRAAKEGLRVRLNSKSGLENEIFLPKSYIDGFLEGARGA